MWLLRLVSSHKRFFLNRNRLFDEQNFLFIKKSWNICITFFTKILRSSNCWLVIIRNVNWAPNQHIRIITEESFDTEDWSNMLLFSVNAVKYIKWKTVILNWNNISQYYCFYCIFYQISAALVSIRDYFQNINLHYSLFDWFKLSWFFSCLFSTCRRNLTLLPMPQYASLGRGSNEWETSSLAL